MRARVSGDVAQMVSALAQACLVERSRVRVPASSKYFSGPRLDRLTLTDSWGWEKILWKGKKPQPVKEVEGDVVCAAAGGMHNVYINSEGNVYTFGCNDEGALGKKIEEEEESFNVGQVEGVGKAVYCCAGDSHTAVINEAGEVWIWGTFRDANGRLGAGTGEEKSPFPMGRHPMLLYY